MYNKCWLFKGIIMNSPPPRHDVTKYDASSPTCCSSAQHHSPVSLDNFPPSFYSPQRGFIGYAGGFTHAILELGPHLQGNQGRKERTQVG